MKKIYKQSAIDRATDIPDDIDSADEFLEWAFKNKVKSPSQLKAEDPFDDYDEELECPRCGAYDSMTNNGDVSYCIEQCGHID